MSAILISCFSLDSKSNINLQNQNLNSKILNEFKSEHFNYREKINDFCGNYKKDTKLDYSNKLTLLDGNNIELVVDYINKNIKISSFDSIFLVNYIYDGSYSSGKEFSKVYSLVVFNSLEITEYYYLSVDIENNVKILNDEKYKAIYDYYTRINQSHSCQAGLSSIVKFDKEGMIEDVKVTINPEYLIEFNIQKVPKKYRLKEHYKL